MSKLREKLDQRNPIFGTHVSLNEPVITQLLGRIGFDFIWIDTEHSAIDLFCLEMHMIAARAAGTATLVRVPWFDNVRAKPVLEMGPDGIVFPMVHSYEEAKEAIEGCLYPPEGKRGFGPRMANNFGNMPLDEYIDWVNHQMLKTIQIEHVSAVNDLDRILTIPEIDAFIIGPCDLSSSIGKLNRFDDPEVKALIENCMRKITDAGRIVGVSFAEQPIDDLIKWRKRGATMFSIGMDTDYLQNGARSVYQKLNRLYETNP